MTLVSDSGMPLLASKLDNFTHVTLGEPHRALDVEAGFGYGFPHGCGVEEADCLLLDQLWVICHLNALLEKDRSLRGIDSEHAGAAHHFLEHSVHKSSHFGLQVAHNAVEAPFLDFLELLGLRKHECHKRCSAGSVRQVSTGVDDGSQHEPDSHQCQVAEHDPASEEHQEPDNELHGGCEARRTLFG